jgi:hypothetical protein
MDLRTARRQFFDKKLMYACSYDPQLSFEVDEAMAVPGGVRVNLGPRSGGRAAPVPIGAVFHVLDSFSVEGVDGRKHSCPIGSIETICESILIRDDTGVGDVEGRMTMQTDDHATIDVTYSGKLRFRSHPAAALAANRALHGGAWLVPRFVTLDTRYHWLSEHTCVAFGTWTADPVARSATRNVTMNLDVYSAG